MITHVAIVFNDAVYSLPAPNRHHHVIRHVAEVTGAESVLSHGKLQGFLDDSGKYLDRFEALAHALACGQVKDPTQVRGHRLFSEDVW